MSSYAYANIYVFDKTENIIRAEQNNCVDYMKSLYDMGCWDDDALYDMEKPSALELEPNIKDLGYINEDSIVRINKNFIDKNTDYYIQVSPWFDPTPLEQDKQIRNNTEFCKVKDVKGWKRIFRRLEYDGQWTDIATLSDYVEKQKAKVKQHNEDLYQLNSIKKSVEYYKMKDSEKEALNNDISYNEDMIDDICSKIEACIRLIGAMDWAFEENHKEYDDIVKAYVYIC